MEATVTNLGFLRHLTALALFASPAFARPVISPQSDLLYVQAPAWSATQPYLIQPVIPPAVINEGQSDQVGHLWPRLVTFSLETTAAEPFVQSNLRVGMQYNYSFNFELNARNNQGKALAIPEGWYQLQIAVIRKSRDTISTKAPQENPYDRYVTSTSMFVRVSSGSFGRKISLRFPDISATALKHHLYVELIPLRDECEQNTELGAHKFPCIALNKKGEPDPLNSILEPRPNYKTYLVEMPFVPYMSAGGKMRDADDIASENLPFTEDSLTQYIVKAQAHRGRANLLRRRGPTPSEHAAEENLYPFDTNDQSLAGVQSLLQRLLSAEVVGNLKITNEFKPLLAALCAELAARNTQRNEIRFYKGLASLQQKALLVQIRNCQIEPQKFLRLTRILHVGKPVASEVKRILQKPLNYTIMANYMSNRSSSVDTFSGVNVKPIPVVSQALEQIGISMGHTINYGNSRSQAQTGIASMSTTLDFNYIGLSIPTLGSQQCLDVRAVADPFSPFYNRAPGAKNGLYICAPVSEEKINVAEVYAHAFERCKDTTLMDCDSLTQSVNVAMRGDRDISQFFYAIRGGISPDHKNLVAPFGDMEGANRYFANTPAVRDMEIITPIEFPRDPVPSFLERIVPGQYQEKF